MKYKRVIKNCILDELTTGQYCLFDKEKGYARYNDTDLTMVMESVVKGISKANELIEKDITKIVVELLKYKNAWEELKEYITKENITIQGVEVLEQEDLIDKMQELEQKHNLDNKQVSIVERGDKE